MGLLNKIKGILFEEIEDDEEVSTSKKEKKEDTKPIAEKIEPQKRYEEPVEKVAPKPTQQVFQEPKLDNVNERDLFKSDNSFSFPDFDEEEFTNMSRVSKPKATTNVLEYERKKKTEKRYDMGRFEKIERTEVVEKKKFKPSPIISPVYGILNEDYKPEDIKNKSEVSSTNNLDFNSVRKKAFGEEKEPTTTLYEETVTVKLKEDEEEKKQKVKTIDELLEDTSDITIPVNDDDNHENEKLVEKPEVVNDPLDYEKVDEDLEELSLKNEENKNESKQIEEDDTLENDLFDLIDSMYDNREDGDI